MTGLESYNICYSPDYSVKFGFVFGKISLISLFHRLDTNFLWRYAPKDWIIPTSADVLHSQAPYLRKSVESVMMKKEAVTRIFEDGKYEKEIEEILRYCAPIVVTNSRGVNEIRMRKRNLFYSKNFNNSSQLHDKKSRRISAAFMRASVSWMNDVPKKNDPGRARQNP